VANAVRDFSVNLPGGTIRSEGGEILLRTDSQAYDQSDFEKIVLRSNADGTILRLSDVAKIDDGFESVDQISLFNGSSAAFVDVLQVGDQKVLDIEEKVKSYVNSISLPEGIKATTWANSADVLRSRIDLLVRNGLMGVVLVFAVLVLFLNLKLAFWTTIGIPISFLGAFLLIAALGGTINMVSLFAFIVVLGIVVDDAIIVGESIYSKREQGVSGVNAALEGMREVMVPVTVGMLTTIFAFVPLLFTSGFLGQILSIIPIVVVSVLLISLIEAFMILPAHLSNVRVNNIDGAIPLVQAKLRSKLQSFIYNVYTPILCWALRMPYVIVAIALSILILTIGALNNGQIKTVFFPSIDGDDIAGKLRMPNGTPATETEQIIRHMLAMAEKTRNKYDGNLESNGDSIFQNISANVGSTPFSGRGGPGGAQSSSSGSHFGEVKIELSASDSRLYSASEIDAHWRELIGEIPGAQITIYSNVLDACEDINVELSHANFESLLIATEQLKNVLSDYSGVVEIRDSFELGKPELQLELTDAGLASGLTLTNLARQVRQAYYGEEAQRVQRGRDDVEVLVRYSEKERRDVSSIYDMRIRLGNGDEVPFRTVALAKEARGYSTIDRANRRRIVSVTAKVEQGSANANEINKSLKESILPSMVADIPGLSYDFEGAEKERKESFSSLLKALSIAMLGIFALLAVQLRSYTQPIIIMSVIPIGFVGAVLGHQILGYTVSFFSFFGIVALSGVVINDALILMDMINRLRNQGKELIDAVMEASQRRFRPIMFTTLTTCAGLAPIISEKSLQAQFLIPMAISLAAGVAFATMITLLLVPSLYVIRANIINYIKSNRNLIKSEINR
jgi:multidrug efflux pump subunit AcrB